MRGTDRRTARMFGYPGPEETVPRDHPPRLIRPLANAAPDRLSPAFRGPCPVVGRPSIPPERLLRAPLPRAFFPVRSERQLMERPTYDMMFRRFVGPSMDAAVWDVTAFARNRDRPLEGDIARGLPAALPADPGVAPPLPDDHFSVDGTPVEAWASMKGFRPRDGGGEPPGGGRNGERDFHGGKGSSETHASTTDPDARLHRKAKGRAARPCRMGHVAMEDRNGLAVDATVALATGTAEREAAAAMVGGRPGGHRITRGADKAHDAADFVAEMRRPGVTPHVARNDKGRRSAIDGRTTRHAGCGVGLRVRRRIGEVFGWMRTAGGQRKTRFRGTARVDMAFTPAAAACNPIRMPKPPPAATWRPESVRSLPGSAVSVGRDRKNGGIGWPEAVRAG